MDRDLLHHLVALFIGGSIEEARDILRNYPEFISDRTDGLFQYSREVARQENETEFLRRLEERYALFRACRERGLEAVIAESVRDEELRNTMESYLLAGSIADSYKIIQGHPELHSDEGLRLLGKVQSDAREQGLDQLVQLADEYLVLLRRCREVGVAKAYAELVL